MAHPSKFWYMNEHNNELGVLRTLIIRTSVLLNYKKGSKLSQIIKTMHCARNNRKLSLSRLVQKPKTKQMHAVTSAPTVTGSVCIGGDSDYFSNTETTDTVHKVPHHRDLHWKPSQHEDHNSLSG